MSSMNKTIFYVSDDGGEANEKAASIRVPEQAKRASSSRGGLEGLRIVIHEGDEKGPSNNVLTKSVTTTATSRPRRLPLPESGFLQTCCFCMRELKPCRDVYMYRGDQGFCSDECRSRQIDWANEESLK